MGGLAAAKAVARKSAYAARARAAERCAGRARQAAAHLIRAMGALRGRLAVSGYSPISTEIDPTPALLMLYGLGHRLCLPVMVARDAPLRFRAWSPGAVLVPGPFGIPVPEAGDWLEPDLMIVPLLAFDANCFRLGYGGGYYDRTLADLRSRKDVRAFGFAYEGQRMDEVPSGAHDLPLDAVVTPAGIVTPA